MQTIPGFIVYQRTSGLTAADKQKIAADAAKFRSLKGVAADQVGRPQYSPDGKIGAVAVPLVGKDARQERQGPRPRRQREAGDQGRARPAPRPGFACTAPAPAACSSPSSTRSAASTSSLLLAAGLVVILILLFVYRSPVLWFFPLFSAVLALGAASLVIYPLAKNGVITLNGQSQGILSVLVIGAGTDYALLLVSRYREELHEYQSRVEAMMAAWKGAAPPILASAVTVILGLICLTVADLNSTAGLGPVCAIGIACTVVVMLTVLPALLVVSGRWIFWPKRPKLDHQTDISPCTACGAGSRRSWRPATAAPGSAPRVVLIACIAGHARRSRPRACRRSTASPTSPTPSPASTSTTTAFPKAKGAGAPADILANADKAQAVIDKVKGVKGVATTPNAVCVQLDYAKVAALVKQNPGLANQQATTCPPAALQVKPQRRQDAGQRGR